MKDIELAEKIVNLANFNFIQLNKLLVNNYPLVQHRCLNLINWMTSYDHITILRQMFVDDNGTAALVKLLEVIIIVLWLRLCALKTDKQKAKERKQFILRLRELIYYIYIQLVCKICPTASLTML